MDLETSRFVHLYGNAVFVERENVVALRTHLQSSVVHHIIFVFIESCAKNKAGQISISFCGSNGLSIR